MHDYRVCEGVAKVAATLEQTQADVPEFAHVQVQRPKRIRRPHHLLHKYKVGMVVARRLDDNMFNILGTMNDYARDLNTLEAETLAAAQDAREAGSRETTRLASTDPVQAAGKYKDVRQARKMYRRASVESNKALLARLRAEGASHAAAKNGRMALTQVQIQTDQATLAVRNARLVQRLALARLRKAIMTSDARFLRVSQRLGPKAAWIKQLQLATDAGSPTENSCKLLEYLTDGDGRVVSRQRSENIRRLQANRLTVSQVSSTLTATCEENLSAALVAVSVHNQELVDAVNSKIHPDSVIAQTARDPMVAWRSIDERRGKQERNLAIVLQQFAAERARGTPHAAFAKRDHVKQVHADAHARLQAPYTVVEVAAAMAKIEDVGSGVDSLEPVVWTCHDMLHRCDSCKRAAEAADAASREDSCSEQADEKDGVVDGKPESCHTADVMCGLFNRIRVEGHIPDRWRHHRSLAHYKGKKTDPHCPDNYRYLGIGSSALHLLSLVMLERLNTFLTDTNGLSRAQHGFQRGRGTPEAILTLTEVVRAALRRHAVTATFIDITRAYDSVLGPILWQRCLNKGIDGSFLAVLQSIYYQTDTQLDIGGILLGAIPMEAGVIQGSALSPALFNIYIDEAIREVEEAGRLHHLQTGRAFGLPVPRTNGHGQTWSHSNALEQADYMPMSFYADDGTLLETDVTIMQTMLEILERALSDVGLTINVKKTKCMVVAKFGTKAAIHEAHVQRLVASPLLVNGQTIDVVDRFDYLGAMLNSDWSWADAWSEACKEVRVALARALVGGFHRTGTLDAMRQHAEGKILCHLTYILALTGAGGLAHREGQKTIHGVLHTIAGYPFLNGDALAIEAGVWDLETRIHNLLLRFWCKIAVSDPLSLVYRAACLSIEQWHRPYELDVYRPRGAGSQPWTPLRSYQDPSTWYARSSFVNRQPWAQQLTRAATAFGLDATAVLQMRVAAVVNLEVQRADHTRAWDTIDTSDAAAVIAVRDVRPPRLRLLAVDDARAEPTLYQFEKSDKVTAATVFSQWSPTLRQACFESLRRRGNRSRQVKVQAFLVEQVQEGKNVLRRWASMRSGSYRHPYWYCTDLVASRRLIRLLLGRGPHEECVRQRPYSSLVPGTLEPSYVLLPRLDNWADRVCYLCGHPRPQADDGSGAVNVDNGWAAETLEHMLFSCQHPSLVAQRRQLQVDLQLLVQAADTQTVVQQSGQVHTSDATPDTHHPSVLMTIFTMSVALGPSPVLQPEPIRVGTSTSTSTTRDAATPLDRERARRTTTWVSALLSHYSSHVRDSRVKVIDPDQLPGGRLVALVCKWAMDLFVLHRRAVRDNAEYRHRLRDPPNLMGARVAPKTTPAQRAAVRKQRKQQRRRPPPLGPAGRAMVAKRRGDKYKARGGTKTAGTAANASSSTTPVPPMTGTARKRTAQVQPAVDMHMALITGQLSDSGSAGAAPAPPVPPPPLPARRRGPNKQANKKTRKASTSIF
jgi:hypothetical protein